MAEKKEKAETKKKAKPTAKKPEVKKEKKAPVKNTESVKKAESVKKVPEVKVETEAKPEAQEKQKEEKPEKKCKSCCGKVWLAVILTFLFTTLVFGVVFFVFMNLEVVNDEGRVRIDHGRIYVDGRQQCSGEVIPSEDDKDEKTEKDEKSDSKDETGRTSTGSSELIANPNPRVAVKNAQLIEIGDFEFYLPNGFKAAKGSGNGKYIFNLTDDDGWADVKVYAEKMNGDLLEYMSKKDSLLKLTNTTYYMNGTSWAEMESGSSLAYGTRLGEMVYVVILNVRLESDATGEAEQMIPKTIRLKRIYK